MWKREVYGQKKRGPFSNAVGKVPEVIGVNEDDKMPQMRSGIIQQSN